MMASQKKPATMTSLVRSRAVFAVHEKENDQRGFDGGDDQRDHDVQQAEISDRRQRRSVPVPDHQRQKNHGVYFRRYDVFRHAILHLRQMPVDQIQQREQINPHNVNEVPVQADVFDGVL